MARPKQKQTATLTQDRTEIIIKAPNLAIASFPIVGASQLVMNRFPEKALDQIKSTQEAGSKGKNKRVREPKDFDACYEAAIHYSHEGWIGIPAKAFRSACIDACRMVDYKMTVAKLALGVIADGFDRQDKTPLVRITKGKPARSILPVRNDNGGIDLRARPMWSAWEATVRIRYDADQFSATDIANLMMRAGMQCGILEGRPSSPNSHGMGWGLFEIKDN